MAYDMNADQTARDRAIYLIHGQEEMAHRYVDALAAAAERRPARRGRRLWRWLLLGGAGVLLFLAGASYHAQDPVWPLFVLVALLCAQASALEVFS